MRGVVLCVLAAIGINAIVAAGPADVGMAAANQSYQPAARRTSRTSPRSHRFYQRGARSWVWRTPWW